MVRAVFLDRDGVLNEAPMRDGVPGSPRTREEVRLFPDAVDSVRKIRDAGMLAIVVTNQPDVARGLMSLEFHNRIQCELAWKCKLDAAYSCCHDYDCECRKPNPGLVIKAANRYGIDLSASWMVGDQERDIEAGIRAGCRTVFIDRGYALPKPTMVCVADLASAVKWILQH